MRHEFYDGATRYVAAYEDGAYRLMTGPPGRESDLDSHGVVLKELLRCAERVRELAERNAELEDSQRWYIDQHENDGRRLAELEAENRRLTIRLELIDRERQHHFEEEVRLRQEAVSADNCIRQLRSERGRLGTDLREAIKTGEEQAEKIKELESDVLRQRAAKNRCSKIAGKLFEKTCRLDALLESEEVPEGLLNAIYRPSNLHLLAEEGEEAAKNAWRWFRQALSGSNLMKRIAQAEEWRRAGVRPFVPDIDGESAPAPSLAWDCRLALADLAELLVALGLGDHARSSSPHEIMHAEVLPRVRQWAEERKESAAHRKADGFVMKEQANTIRVLRQEVTEAVADATFERLSKLDALLKNEAAPSKLVEVVHLAGPDSLASSKAAWRWFRKALGVKAEAE